MDRRTVGFGGAQAFLLERSARGPEEAERAEASALGAMLGGVGGVFDVPLDRIAADPAQPRKVFDEGELRALAANLTLLGQLQPAVVRPVEGEPGRYLLVMGERRWRAAQLAGLPSLQCILRHEDARFVPAKQWAENHFRADLSPIEEAGAIRSVMELEGLDVAGFAGRYGLSERTVRRYLQLLSAPVWIQSAVVKGEQVPVGDGVETRRLDLTGAVELQRIHNTYLRQAEAIAQAGAQGEKGLDRTLAAAAKKAQQRAEAVKRKALRENWSRRRWQSFAAAASSAKAAPATGQPAGSRRASLYEEGEGRLVVHLDRLQVGARAEVTSLAQRIERLAALLACLLEADRRCEDDRAPGVPLSAP